MSKKYLSLIVVPHSKAGSKSITFSKKAIKAIGGGLIFFFAVLLFFTVDYFYIRNARQKYKDLIKENQAQRETITGYEESIRNLQKTIDNFENYAKKLNLMAGLKSPEVLKELGVGGQSIPGSEAQLNPVIPQSLSMTDLKSINQKADDIEQNLNTLMIFFENQAAKLASTPTIWPTKGWVTSGFGRRKDPFTGQWAYHKGMDIATNFGNQVVASADGLVVQVKYEKIGGNTVIISHGEVYSTVYCHLSKFLVKEGQKIKRGDVLGLVGKTGKALGPHLHYEVRIYGKSQNPYNYILEEED